MQQAPGKDVEGDWSACAMEEEEDERVVALKAD
jgi:hypothetical protein